MKIIDLIELLINNKIMPKHIIFEEEDYYWVSSINDYVCSDHDATQLFNNQYNMSNLPLFLGKKVEILEEEKKIPEKLNIELNSGDENKINYYRATNLECDLAFKINEIIDYLDYFKSKGE